MSPSNSLVPLPPESAEHCFCLNLVDDEGDRKWNPKPFKPFAFPVRILNLVSPLLPWESSHPTAVFFAKDQRKKSRKETLRIVMAYRERPDFCVTGKESQHNAFSTQEVSPGTRVTSSFSISWKCCSPSASDIVMEISIWKYMVISVGKISYLISTWANCSS